MPLTPDELKKIEAALILGRKIHYGEPCIAYKSVMELLKLYMSENCEKYFIVRREKHKLLPAFKAIFK